MRGEDILMELENSVEEWEERLTIPSPPRGAGILNKSGSIAFGGTLPVSRVLPCLVPAYFCHILYVHIH